MGSALVRLWTAPRAGDAPSNTRRSGKTPGERGGSADSHAGEAGSNVGRLCGVILSGPPADIGLEVIAGRALAWLVALFRGAARPSPLLDRMAFGAYRRRVSDGRTPCDWLSRDQHEVDNYVSSPYCGFTPSPGLFQELIRSVHEAGRARPAGASADVPVLIAAGSEDPVGRFGEAPRRLQASIRRHHGAAVDLRLYHGARHEVLNETNRDEVVGDLLAWVRRAMPAQ
jgi:alpha-beta hydrolase superfamily lysophospholipase